MTKQWLKMHKHDSYYKQAKAQGYRSRAAYKLQQINNKFKLIRRGNVVLDLGAAPGGWLQVASELVGGNGRVIGVDLNSIKEIPNVILLVGDITDPKLIDSIRAHLTEGCVDVVLSDAAPNISGNYSIDQARSVFLAEAALNLAKQLLSPNGNFVVKVFEGEDFQEFFNQLKTLFRQSKKFSPQASRARSSEIYAIGLGFKK
jgi:23S rRNA (uridine2552-2'-O)-methyltransferase